MNTPELIKEISKRTGLPETKVRKAVFDFCRDMNSIVCSKSTGGFVIPKIGYVSVNVLTCISQMHVQIKAIEKRYKFNRDRLATGHTTSRTIFTKLVDDFYALANIILENELIGNETYKKGAGKKKSYNKDVFAKLMVRMDNILNDLPTTLYRSKYTEIQKICLRRMHQQGILQHPGDKDCEVHPLRVCS